MLEMEEGEAGIEGEELWALKLPELTLLGFLRECPRPYKRLRLTSLCLPASLDWVSMLPSHLTHLSLLNSRLTDSSPVLSVLTQLPCLSCLDLSGNYIRVSSGEWLCGLVALEELTLSDNWLGSQGLVVLSAQLLGKVSKLKALRLSKVGAGGEGLIRLLVALSHSQVTNLDLSYNSLHTPGYEALLAFLPVSILQCVNLEGNCLSETQVLGLLQLCAFLRTPSLLLADNFTSAEVSLQVKCCYMTIQTMANMQFSTD